MNLSRPDRPQRLDALASAYALGTLPARARSRLARVATAESSVAAAIRDWEMRLATLSEGAATTPTAADTPWWARIAFWRSFALTSFALAMAFGVTLFGPGMRAPEQPIVAVLAGPDAKPALIATMLRGERTLTIKAVGAAAVPAGKSLELWLLPKDLPPKSLGVIPGSGMGRVALAAPPDVALANVPALAVTLEVAGGSPTGSPQGPVLYTGTVERFY
jgi:anti-sigma-K factor RskA